MNLQFFIAEIWLEKKCAIFYQEVLTAGITISYMVRNRSLSRLDMSEKMRGYFKENGWQEPGIREDAKYQTTLWGKHPMINSGYRISTQLDTSL